MNDLHVNLPQWMKVPSPPVEVDAHQSIAVTSPPEASPSRILSNFEPGSAQLTSLRLGRLGLGCGHFPKGFDPALHDHEYPSRLGFFHAHTTNQLEPPHISVLETDRFCLRCLDKLVPGRIFNYWTVVDASSSDFTRRWLLASPSTNTYPPLHRSGTEGFHSHRQREAESTTILGGAPVTLPIPDIHGAEEAWAWLCRERRPFYIDSLHLDRGWRLVAEKQAERDIGISRVHGVPFVPVISVAEAPESCR